MCVFVCVCVVCVCGMCVLCVCVCVCVLCVCGMCVCVCVVCVSVCVVCVSVCVWYVCVVCVCVCVFCMLVNGLYSTCKYVPLEMVLQLLPLIPIGPRGAGAWCRLLGAGGRVPSGGRREPSE